MLGKGQIDQKVHTLYENETTILLKQPVIDLPYVFRGFISYNGSVWEQFEQNGTLYLKQFTG
jgi:hypothetical protein